MNSHSPVGLVSRQWDAIDWAGVLCDRHIYNDRASRSASSRQCTCPFYSSCAGLYGKASHHPGLSAPLQPRSGSLWLLAFPKAKIAIERVETCECDGHTIHRLSQWCPTADWLAPPDLAPCDFWLFPKLKSPLKGWRLVNATVTQYTGSSRWCLTADWLAPQESDCLWMHSKVSSDSLPSYIKATWPLLKIFKMAGNFPGNPRIHPVCRVHRSCLIFHLFAKSWRTAIMGNSCHWTAPNVASRCLLLNLYLLLSRSLPGDTLFGWCRLYIRTGLYTVYGNIYFFIIFVTKNDCVSYSRTWIM
jgi:hypothetical protein